MIRIAIDGPGGAGKSSVAKAVASKLGIINGYPDGTFGSKNTVSYAEIMYKSNFTPTNAHNRIDSTLSKQHNDVSMQKMSLERITQNTNINPVMIQKERQ